MLDDAGAFRFGDLARAVRRRGVDDEDLVEQRHAPDHLAHRPADDRPDRLLLVERRQDQADGQVLLLLERDEASEVGELGMVEVRLAEPALDADRDGPRLLGGAVRGGQGLRPRGQLVEGVAGDGLARPDHDDRRLRARGDGFREGAEQVALPVRPARRGRRAHDDEVGLLGLAQDRVADVGRLAQERLAATVEVLLDERGQGALRLRPDRERDPRRDEVEDDDRRGVEARDRIGIPDRELGMRAAADRHEDALDVLGATLLDDRDVARGVAHDLVDGRREDRGPVAVATGRRPAAPAEDDEVGLLLGRGLDDALGGVAPDADDRVDRRAVRGVVEHALEQPTGVAGPRRAFRERHPLGHLDDPERRDLAVLGVEHRGAEADQFLGRHRVGDRDEDARRQRRPAGHRASGLPTLDEVRLEELELAGLAFDALLRGIGRDVAVLDDEAADPTEVDRDEGRDERLERRALARSRRSRGARRRPGRRRRGPTGRRGSGTSWPPRPSRACWPSWTRRPRRCRAWSARCRRGCRPRPPAPGRSPRSPGRASPATCPRGSASRRGTRTGAGACSPRAAAVR